MTEVFVLTKEYSDKSGYTVVRAYVSEDRALADMDLVKDDSVYEWRLHRIECVECEKERA